ncbi:MAG: hypothetical protein NT069_04475 [Planctomycetota bacterium]|nr:hypothetical protein [Planctomycetota bacterium]
MARQEQDREDLIAEATALRTRVEFQLPHPSEPVVVGQRSNGCLSVYFGADPVYHFDENGGLRRAFAAGVLYRSEQETLSRLIRHRPDQQTSELLRSDLTVIECEEFLHIAHERLDELCGAIDAGKAVVLRQVSPEEDPVGTLRRGLETARGGRLSPRIGLR